MKTVVFYSCPVRTIMRLILVNLFLLLGTSVGSAQVRIYVDSANGNDTYSGSSWSSAFRNLTKALTVAKTSTAGEVDIWVSKGTYTPIDGVLSLPLEHRDTSFALYRGNGIGKTLKLYGGFAGTESSVAARDTFHRTRLDGAIGGGKCSYHVAVINGIGASADSLVIDGFTFSNGFADTVINYRLYNGITVKHYCGAGIYLSNDSSSKTVIRHCRVINNWAGDTTATLPPTPLGAGIYSFSTTAYFEDCDFLDNKCGGGLGFSPPPAYGAAVYTDSSNSRFVNCNFTRNIAQGYFSGVGGWGGQGLGGGVYGTYSSLTLSGCVFSNNSANGIMTGTGAGGSIFIVHVTGAITNCSFIDNRAYGVSAQGGAIYSAYSNLPFILCHFSNNYASGGGASGWSAGGVWYSLRDTVLARDCTFYGNYVRPVTGGAAGGAVATEETSFIFSNCVFDSNSVYPQGSAGVGGSVTNLNSKFSIDSCTFSNNFVKDTGSGGGVGGAIRNVSSAGRITHSLFSNNSANSHLGSCSGGAISNTTSTPTISDCTFSGNRLNDGGSVWGGGGAIIGGSSNTTDTIYPNIIRCNFSGNRSSQYGGAILQTDGKILIRDCNFTSDTALQGGAVHLGNGITALNPCYITAIGNVFQGNISTGGGGAIGFKMNGGTDTLYNNIFLLNKNTGSLGGGALRIKGDTHFIANNIFYCDSALLTGAGGAMLFEGTGGNYKVANNIFYKNGKASSVNDTNFVSGSTYTFTHNTYSTTNPVFTLESNPAGPDNLWRTADDGFHIARCSPARNTGSDTFVDADEITDIAGAPRIEGVHIDMGAYESDVIGNITGIHTVCMGSNTLLTDTSTGGHWQTTDATIATVSPSGLLTGIGVGATNIMYIISDSCGSDTATAAINVVAPSYAGSITGILHVCENATTLLSATISDGTWSATNGHATVNNGLVTGITAGTDTIVYTNSCGTGHAYAYITVYPTPHTGPITGPASVCTGNYILLSDTTTGGTWISDSISVAVSADTVTGITGGYAIIKYVKTNSFGCSDTESTGITVIITPSPGIIYGYDTICRGVPVQWYATHPLGVWSSADTSIAIVDASGIVTGTGAGNTMLYYTVTNACGTVTDSTAIHIDRLAAPISGLSGICIGNSITVSDSTVGGAWSSSNTAIATISPGGVITGLLGGSAIITYTVINVCGLSYEHNVARIDLPAGPITGGDTVCLLGSLTLGNSALYGFWTSSDPTVATVSSAGIATGLTTGAATISYYVTNACGTFNESTTLYVVTSPYCDSVVSIPPSIETASISIHPNPVSSIIHISATIPVEVELTDVAGRLQLPRQHTTDIDVANLPQGVYFMSVYNEKGLKLKTERIVKLE